MPNSHRPLTRRAVFRLGGVAALLAAAGPPGTRVLRALGRGRVPRREGAALHRCQREPVQLPPQPDRAGRRPRIRRRDRR